MSTPDNARRQVFISYASPDRETAERLCGLLEARGVSCWFAPRDIPWGRNYAEEIVGAIEAVDALLLVFSARTNDSRHVHSEVSRAFSKGKRILTLRMEDVQPCQALELFVTSAQWVDAWTTPLDDAADRLARAAAATVRACRSPVITAEPFTPWVRRYALRLTLTGVAALLVLATLGGVTFLRRERPPELRSAPSARLAPATAETAAPLWPRCHALVIGISAYHTPAGEGWTTLRTARSDAEAVADVLEQRYGFQVQRLFDEKATRAGIVAALDGLSALNAGDAALIYFAGHGYYDAAQGEGYWIPGDARRIEGSRYAKEDWVWNSTITRIVGAAAARHVLILADACYGGSLFRGEEPPAVDKGLAWYRQAVARPSRYLISSGGLEPVLDSGAGHSVFAQQVLNSLDDPAREVFSASDLGREIREKVSALTGQMVQMGPLAVAVHANGEFVFVKKDAAILAGGEETAAAFAPPAPPPGPASPPAQNASAVQDLRDAVALGTSGATNAAAHLLRRAAASGDSEGRLCRAVAAYLDQDRRARSAAELRDLIRAVQEHGAAKPGPAAPETARPRVLACLGPTVRGGGADAESEALLVRLALRGELERLGRVQVVEREALEQILQEMNVGSSDLADPRASTAIGKLLPAGMLLLGDLIPTAGGQRVYLRLVETETTRVLDSFSGDISSDAELSAVCEKLAGQVSEKAAALKPLSAQVTRIDGDRLTAGVGRFHGVREGDRFSVVRRRPLAGGAGSRDQPAGKATVANAGENSSELSVQWEGGTATPPTGPLWVVEAGN